VQIVINIITFVAYYDPSWLPKYQNRFEFKLLNWKILGDAGLTISNCVFTVFPPLYFPWIRNFSFT